MEIEFKNWVINRLEAVGRYEVAEEGQRYNVVAKCHVAKFGKRGQPTRRGVKDLEHAKANAHLIAAAPDMLNVLWAMYQSDMFLDLPPHWQKRVESVYQKARGR